MMPEAPAPVLREPRTPATVAAWIQQHRRAVEAVTATAVFVALAIVRTWRISETFWLLGEQIRDWTIALGSWRDLPLSGTPSTAGGRSLGPIYYWTLWAIRHVIGPWCDNLPHAGGIGISIIQSASDAVLLVAVWRRFRSFATALGVVLLIATEAYDLSLSATIWNPPLAVALAKFAIACVLFDPPRRSSWHVARLTVVAWLAVQAHSSALFIATPLLGMTVVEEIGARRWRTAWMFARLIVELIVILEVPFLIDRLMHPAGPVGPAGLVAGVARAAAHPSRFHLASGVEAMLSALQFIVVAPWNPVRWFTPAVVMTVGVAAIVIVVRRDWRLGAVTLLPVLTAVIGYSTLERPLESYWLLTLSPCLVLTFATALAAIRPDAAARAAAAALLVVAVASVPARREMSTGLIRIAEYGPLQRGSREIRRHTAEIAAIDVTFPLPSSTDPAFLFTVLGGRVTPDAPYRATIDRDGRASYQPAAR